MKVALINDVHYGARSDSDVIASHQELFYKDIFFPYLFEHDVKDIFILGDVFERRKYVNFKTLDRALAMVFDPARQMGIDVKILTGNHDSYHSNSNKVNSPTLLLNQRPGITVFAHDPVELKLGECYVGVVPWVNESNRSAVNSFLKNTLCEVIFGHFDITGFEMSPGVLCENGEDPATFARFHKVYSGHYHRKSVKGNITQLGTQYDMDWADYGDQKQFHIFDTETHEIEPIINPHKAFVKLYYNDGLTSEVPELRSKFVKLVVLKKSDAFVFEKCVDKLKSQVPESFSIIDAVVDDSGSSTTLEEGKSIQTMMREYILNTSYIPDGQRKAVDTLMTELHQEAVAA